MLNDLKMFQLAQAGVLKQDGCLTRTSGMHPLWQVFTDYAVGEAGEVVR